MGYVIDGCLRLAEVIHKKAGVRDLPIDDVKVTAADRMDVIAQDKANLVCDSTTHHAERREKVAFTVPHFIVGARILVRANSTVTRLEDLSNKTGGPAGGAFRAGDERFFVVRRRREQKFFSN
ncbi:transporter substrate-binding domain-containing protein [Curvibacter lanceolatus]|uniref:transporter substrate-binding domain-containing protein n=1 Tax=Curvibacter lanceolatus TaxID=86182 RepID=UPI001FDF4C13